MRFVKESFISATPERLFAFHELPDAFELLAPPWESVKESCRRRIFPRIGSRAIIEQKLFGVIPSRWVAEHTVYDPPRMFEDVQISGPFARWRHKHIVEPHADGALLRDEIEFEPPMWFFGKLVAPILIVPKLEKMFEFRHKVTGEWCESKI